jgi:hypothetical protein
MTHGCISENNDRHAARGKVAKAPEGNWQAKFNREVLVITHNSSPQKGKGARKKKTRSWQ